MATVTREQIGTLHDKLTVKLLKSDFLPNFENAIKQYAKTANMPGFRKGMVPMAMVRKMAGQKLFGDQLMETAGKQLESFMRQERVAIFGQPMMIQDAPMYIDFNNPPAEVEFKFEIGIKPQFEIAAIRDRAHLIAYRIMVTDKMLDDEVERIKRRFGKVENQRYVTGKEDVIYCTFEPCDEHGVVTVDDVKEETVLLGKMPAKLEELLMGKEPGAEIVFKPAEACTAEELPKFLKDPLRAAPEMADHFYILKLTKVGLLIPMDLGFELYGQVFPHAHVTGETDFRDKLKVELQREFDRIARERYHNEIFELLVHTTDITLPVPFLKRWLKEGGQNPKTEIEVETEFGAFEHQLRWQLISEQIIQQHRISVTREEVMNDIKARILAQYGMDADEDVPWMHSYLEKALQDNKLGDETFRRLLTEKVFLVLENQFNTEMQEIEEEAFFKLPSAHAAHHHHGHQH